MTGQPTQPPYPRSTPEEIHAELAQRIRVPLADMARIILDAKCSPDAIEAAIMVTADGIADACYRGIANALETGKEIERFKQSAIVGNPQ